ncbi:MAG: hypothetical protein EYC62_01120 [Alphaproteobacteria bacterium]|nr:MAG: hypothetical protein EYC62_01120 [Alphaproteobacteria bacterium]
MESEDKKTLLALEQTLFDLAKGKEAFYAEVPKLIRRSIDEVIDTPRTQRLKLKELEKTEKAYIGTKIEILLRDFLDIPKGVVLDLQINGLEVDIKNTIKRDWMIPQEAFGKICILVRSSEEKSKCDLGLIVTRTEYLSKGQNQDKKKRISAEGQKQIYWIMKDYPYPRNFWEDVEEETAKAIMSASSGNKRLVTLFKNFPHIPISRQIIEGVGRQKDFMRRIRKGGGARDFFKENGIALLSGTFDSEIIEQLGLKTCSKEEFIAVEPNTPEAIQILKNAGHL